jgi:hypothetical protein
VQSTSIHVRFSGANLIVKEALDLYVEKMKGKQIVKDGRRQPMSMNDCIIYILRDALRNELGILLLESSPVRPERGL